ncbi:MAG: 2-phosphosulfolactate phosphatase [Desulfococcaceae bacterium]
MRIDILHGIAGARKARGVAIVIDVFRAFTLAPCAFSRGVERILPVAKVAEARRWKTEHPDWILVAERDGKPVGGADFGNSPSQILAADLAGRSLVHTTSAGTRGLDAARDADLVLTGAFVNADAVVRHVRENRPERVSIVAMGSAGIEPSPEDTACAEYLRDRLRGERPDFHSIADRLRTSPAGRKFGDPARPWFPAADLAACLDLNRFDQALLLDRDDAFGRALRPVRAVGGEA